MLPRELYQEVCEKFVAPKNLASLLRNYDFAQAVRKQVAIGLQEITDFSLPVERFTYQQFASTEFRIGTGPKIIGRRILEIFGITSPRKPYERFISEQVRNNPRIVVGQTYQLLERILGLRHADPIWKRLVPVLHLQNEDLLQSRIRTALTRQSELATDPQAIAIPGLRGECIYLAEILFFSNMSEQEMERAISRLHEYAQSPHLRLVRDTWRRMHQLIHTDIYSAYPKLAQTRLPDTYDPNRLVGPESAAQILCRVMNEASAGRLPSSAETQHAVCAISEWQQRCSENDLIWEPLEADPLARILFSSANHTTHFTLVRVLKGQSLDQSAGLVVKESETARIVLRESPFAEREYALSLEDRNTEAVAAVLSFRAIRPENGTNAYVLQRYTRSQPALEALQMDDLDLAFRQLEPSGEGPRIIVTSGKMPKLPPRSICIAALPDGDAFQLAHPPDENLEDYLRRLSTLQIPTDLPWSARTCLTNEIAGANLSLFRIRFEEYTKRPDLSCLARMAGGFFYSSCMVSVVAQQFAPDKFIKELESILESGDLVAFFRYLTSTPFYFRRSPNDALYHVLKTAASIVGEKQITPDQATEIIQLAFREPTQWQTIFDTDGTLTQILAGITPAESGPQTPLHPQLLPITPVDRLEKSGPHFTSAGDLVLYRPPSAEDNSIHMSPNCSILTRIGRIPVPTKLTDLPQKPHCCSSCSTPRYWDLAAMNRKWLTLSPQLRVNRTVAVPNDSSLKKETPEDS